MTCAKQCIPTIQICSFSRMLEWKGNCLRTQTIFRNLFDREFASLPFYAQHKKLLLNGSLAVIYCWVVNKQPKITYNFAIFFLPNDVNFLLFHVFIKRSLRRRYEIQQFILNFLIARMKWGSFVLCKVENVITLVHGKPPDSLTSSFVSSWPNFKSIEIFYAQ